MRRVLAFLLVISCAVPTGACLWDYDTLQMERERFPGALELIVGKFLRHSDTFYEWRVRDRTAKIARHESGEATLADNDLAAAYDDLAVAYDKLSRQDDAIKTIREKAEKLPKVGEYETRANLGTFFVHAGQYEEGLAELKKAIEINPDAHFGREKYQVLLVEYVTQQQGKTETIALPLNSQLRSGYDGKDEIYGFANYILDQAGIEEWQTDEKVSTEGAAELKRATTGVLGMMRIGDYRSPILLEALGDLLLSGTNDSDSKQLAARAYLRASQVNDSPTSKAAYYEMADHAVFGQEKKDGWSRNQTVEHLEDQLAREVKEADAWFAEVAYDEELWVEKSADPDRRYWEKYGDQVITVGHDRLPAGKFAEKGLPVVLRVALGVAFVLTLVIVIGAMAWRRKRPTGYPVGERQA
ncbi:MAG: hypothetical protein M3552_02565 [Planctomycetota bacterium]|nr:tetratricopeptide repeat protein [Planctomycetaceae bacterium]MDQ3329530.1 hypothetical protein [Planctomycetota bacterium]